MTFLEAVNRILREEGIIQGDDEEATSFTQTQHGASLALAQIAVQSELSSLVSDAFIPYEEKVDTITSAADTRTYTLASDFQQFQELFMEELDSGSQATGTRITHYLGGEEQLRRNVPRYREDTGRPINFYIPGGATKSVGLWPVPDSAITYRYYYESDVNVSTETDTVPFTTTTEAQVFVRMAARHFKYLKASVQVREQLFPAGIDLDPVILQSRATLMGLLNPMPNTRTYGKRYGRT